MKTNYTELERKEGQVNGVPYTILKVEYSNLKRLKDNGLLRRNDKGQWLFAYVGLKKGQYVNFSQLEKEVCVAPYFFEKSDTDLFKDNEEIINLVFFDQNHSWNISEKNTQLDEKLCLKSIEKIVNHIKSF